MNIEQRTYTKILNGSATLVWTAKIAAHSTRSPPAMSAQKGCKKAMLREAVLNRRTQQCSRTPQPNTTTAATTAKTK